MRLIDADKLILHLNDYALTEAPDERESAGERRISRIVYSTLQNCMKAVEEQPTAFDTDRIIDQLEELKEEDICKNMSCLLCKYTSQCETGEMGEKVAIDRAIEIVNGAEQLKRSGWIPVAERLPEEDGTYLVTFSDGTILTVGYGTCQRTVLGHPIGHGWYNLYAGSYYADGCIIAWMTLPKRYRED